MFRFRSRFNRKNTSCFYRRNSPCVGLRDAVEANELIVHLGASPTHRMFMTACPTILWDGQKLHKNRIIRVHINVWRLRTVSSPVQKEYLKQYRLIYYSDQTQQKNKYKKLKKLIFLNCRLDYWSGHGRTNRTVCYGPACTGIRRSPSSTVECRCRM